METVGFLENPSATQQRGLGDMEDKKADGAVGVKPWTCARSELFVKAPAKGVRRRLKTLQRDKEALRQGLTSSPYVDLTWRTEKGERHRMTGLVDTGADWSLIEESQLRADEREELQPSEAQGRGVTDADIPIVGEIWRDLDIGGIQVESQRFIVVRKMVTPVILGADFWGRFGQFSINFRERKLQLGDRAEVPLRESPTGNVKPHQQVSLVMDERKTIGASSQTLIRVRVEGQELADGTEILVDPVKESLGEHCGVSYTVATVQGGTVFLRLANIGEDNHVIEEGTLVGQGSTQFSVNVAGLGSKGYGRNEKRKSLDFGSMCGDKLSSQQRRELEDLLCEFEDVFYTDGELGTVHVGVEHHIRLKEETAPIAHRPRRLSPEEEAEVRQEIDDLMEMGVVRQSNSPWAAPIVCARKADGRLRLAIDYRGLNGVSLPATLHHIPRIDDLFDRLGEARYFSVMDAKSGYHQLPLREDEAELTAFVVPWGHYEFAEGTPFGLKGAGYSFQRCMATILGSSNFVEALCYLDDILVWGATWKIHMERLKLVLTKVGGANLKLGPSKCRFGVDEVQYLGTTIRHGMLSVNEQRVETLRNLPSPTTVTELRSALGAFSYIQRWLPGLAEVNRPLNTAANETGTRKLVWTDEMTSSFEKLKQMAAKAVALQIPDMGRQFTLVTDGSDRGVGAMLAQEPTEDAEGMQDHLIPVAFFHHTLTKAEEKYNTTDKELLAVFLAIKRFRVYLGAPFRLITDHMAVKYLKSLNANDEKGRRGRWVEYLQQFDMELVYRGGASKELSIADYLSRVSRNGQILGGKVAVVKVAAEGAIPVKGFLSVETIKEAQEGDTEIQEWKREIERPCGQGVALDGYQKFLGNLVLDERGMLRILYNQGKADVTTSLGNIERYRIVVPSRLRDEVVSFVHASPTGAHMGYKRTYKRCRDGFWWKGMGMDIRSAIKGCEQCGKNKHETHPNQAPLQLTDIPDGTFEKLQVDFMGPYQSSTAHPYRYALQIQDILSRYLIIIPAERNDAATASEIVFEDWFLRIFPPKVIQSDRGTHFAGEVFRGMCRLAGVNHRMGAPGHAPSQGQVERQNQLMNQVRALTLNNGDSWPRALSRVAYAHNIAKNATTGIAPAELVYARIPRTVESELLNPASEAGSKKLSPVEILEIRQKDKTAFEAQAKRMTRQSQMKVAERKGSRGEPYVAGDIVRVKLSTAERGKLGGSKMAPLYSNSYVVREVLGAGWTYVLESENGVGRPKSRHYDSLKLVRRLRDTGHEESETLRVEYEETADIPETPARLAMEAAEPQDDEGIQGDQPSDVHHPSTTEEPPERQPPIRRSARKVAPPARLTVDPSRKRYAEESVPLAEDTALDGEDEEQE